MTNEAAYILCVHCRGTFTEEQTKGWGCPKCGSQSVPADTRQKATLTLTHHEWRILFMWADNWGDQCGRKDENSRNPIPSIIREAKKQAPDLPSLTLMGELQEVANEFGKVELIDASGTKTIEPEKKH